ncbi:YkvA family protein [Psychrobacter urativorans]|uniref:YkvA family protein n=1 Tax=Psychrobacter urativorans TaxID=45610 RepID=UPI0039B74D6E
MTDKKNDDTNLSNNKLYNDKLNGKKEEMLNAARNEKMMDANIEYIIEKEEKLKEKLKKSSHLERFTTDVTLFISLVKDYSQGNYREIPYKTFSAVVLGLLYILNPIDIIPDFIPVIGYIDDALVIAFCLKMVEKDLQNYQTWKQEQPSTDGTADSNVNE